MREAEEANNQSAIDPTTGQFVIPPQRQQSLPPQPQNGDPPDQKPVMNGDIKENGDSSSNDASDLHNNDITDDKNSTDTKPVIKQELTENSSDEKQLKIMLSGFVRSEYEELQSMVEKLGAEVTSQAKLATHLVMPKMGRTISFLCAISYVKYILKPAWIRDSHKENKLLGKYRHAHNIKHLPYSISM